MGWFFNEDTIIAHQKLIWSKKDTKEDYEAEDGCKHLQNSQSNQCHCSGITLPRRENRLLF